ncbi:MAG: ABC transporter permease subunit [Alphaproteobacteria bacterium]|nr:ABC transporter permease subunit [Rhizobiaceae bacterium]MBU3962611.1 ABC transporter permease subunit [Alphaproteobacteria bacterium]MBU4087892.1 ABC transporter permease subunit [Alphaproteobacteria bacterium]
MMPIADRAGRAGRFLWSAWAGLAGLSVFAAAWQLGHEAYGSFILPSPAETLASLAALLRDEANWALVGATACRALLGFSVAAGIGTLVGVIAGYHPAVMRLMRPQVTLLLGVPPIAWIVLLMIWFGNGAGTVVATAAIACLPIVFIGAAEGVATRDRGLDDMARAAGVGPFTRLFRVALRQMLHALFPALVMALGTAFKAAVMAELMANAGGVGEALAVARANLDVAAALAWILLAVAALIGVEYGLLQPLRAEFETWREAARPWGVKR